MKLRYKLIFNDFAVKTKPNYITLAIPSHFKPLRWEMFGKVANQGKLTIPSHSEPL